MVFTWKPKNRRKKAMEGRSYKGWIFMRRLEKWGIVRKRFALFATRIDDSTIVWLQFYYTFLIQTDGAGLHSGWHWAVYQRALNPMRFRGPLTKKKKFTIRDQMISKLRLVK